MSQCINIFLAKRSNQFFIHIGVGTNCYIKGNLLKCMGMCLSNSIELYVYVNGETVAIHRYIRVAFDR